MAAKDTQVVTFYSHTTPNHAASKAQGKPVFKTLEVCEIRFAGDRGKKLVFPAHDAEPNATREKGEPVTYAMLHNEQYRKFKANEVQDVSGTPLTEATFLSESNRNALKALDVYTLEALAALDGYQLKQVGMGGREWKNQAADYLASKRGNNDSAELAAQVAALQQQLRDRDELIDKFAKTPTKNKYQREVEKSVREANEQHMPEEPDEEPAPPEATNISFGQLTDAELKAYIKDHSGQPVRGNPSRETLINRAQTLAGEE